VWLTLWWAQEFGCPKQKAGIIWQLYMEQVSNPLLISQAAPDRISFR
jgi:hypothetical protein